MSADAPNLLRTVVKALEDDGRFATQDDADGKVAASRTTVTNETDAKLRRMNATIYDLNLHYGS